MRVRQAVSYAVDRDAINDFIFGGRGTVIGTSKMCIRDRYDIDLAPYRAVMLVLIAAGGFNAVSMLFYYALTVMRLQKEIFAGYTLSLIHIS